MRCGCERWWRTHGHIEAASTRNGIHRKREIVNDKAGGRLYAEEHQVADDVTPSRSD